MHLLGSLPSGEYKNCAEIQTEEQTNKKKNPCLVFKLRMHFNRLLPRWFLMPIPSQLVIFYWDMSIRHSFKSLFIDIQMVDGNGFIPIIWPSFYHLFNLASLMKTCICTLADSLMVPILILTMWGDFPSLSFLLAEVYSPSLCSYLLSWSSAIYLLHIQCWANLQHLLNLWFNLYDNSSDKLSCFEKVD